jgi:polar amino acid transport system substrate-binding protein
MNKSWSSKIQFNWPGNRPRAFLAFINIFFFSLLLSACAPAFGSLPTPSRPLSSQLETILKAGVIVIATDPSAPPQSQLIKNQPRAEKTHCSQTQYTANQLSGFDVEVAKELALRLGVEPCFVTPTWSQIVAGNWGDLWNVTVQSMVITPERMKKLYFTQPYIYGEAVLFVHKDNQSFHQPVDLSGKKIGVCAGCAYESYLRGTLVIPGETIENLIKNPVIIGYDTDTSALNDLAVGDGANLDAVLTDPDTGQAAIRSGLPVKQLSGALYHDYDAMAVDKKSSADPIPLVQKLTEIILQMHQDQTLLKLSQQFYGGDFTSLAAQYDVNALKQIP